MSLRLSKIQKDALNMLLDVYENSVTYKGQNIKNQSFAIKPEKIFYEYNGDYTDQDEVNQFNREMQSLMEFEFVILDYERGIPVISKIKLNTNSINEIYSVLKREDITVKRNREIKMYTQYMGVHDIMDAFCKSQVERLNAYKDAKYTSDIAINILKLLKYVLGNNSDIMERELSVAVLGDTKLFEKSYKSRICSIIEEYGELELDLSVLDKKEKEKAILEEYQVFSNPSYIFFKGNVDIHYVDGSSISVTPDNPIAILSEAIARIEMIKVNSNRIVTVENLTSYNRINDNKSTFIYLSGYHNTAKQRFLKKIAENNSGVSWFHFGDIDPDGYFILKNLIEKTGISFVPLYMDVQQLINYKQYCKPLEKNDMVKANSLLKFHFYDEVMEFMLENNCKLEQEIISWLYERN
ncbi:MAG: DUF2399 domain-containing protein [Lachnospiraceae bacterium]|nr:DUF2399 domain-containing protein [Lachnospiraceae bacterium]